MTGQRESITLHSYQVGDDPFLLTLYISTRQEEMALVDWTQSEKENFLQLQFQAQKDSYQKQAPNAEWRIINKSSQPIGRLIVETRPDEVGLMDIALLPEYRNQGIGTLLITEVMEQSEQLQKPVRLYVYKDNYDALRLYQRLGFSFIGETGMHHWLEWYPKRTQQKGM